MLRPEPESRLGKRIALASVLLVASVAVSFAETSGAAQCSDTLDNDSDGHTDLDDAGCLMDAARDDETGELVVNSTLDAVDAIPGDDVCETATPGECTLRAAVMEANSLPGTQGVRVPAGTFELTIERVGSSPNPSDGDLDIDDDLVLIGAGASQTRIGGDEDQFSDRAFETALDTDVTISGVTVQKCRTGDGGGIFAHGNLLLTNSTISENIALDSGGGIYAEGDLTIVRSTVSSNRSAYGGSGVYIGARSFQGDQATLLMVDSTVSDNIARPIDSGGSGSALWLDGDATIDSSTISGNVSVDANFVYYTVLVEGALTLTNSTISGNTGYGIVNFQGIETHSVNSIVAANTPANCGPRFVSHGHNLSDDTTCFPGTGTDIVAPAQLGPLADHGGPTETHLPLPGSPAIDAGDDAACPETDQRGLPRPQDGDDPPDGMAHCDIGAVELAPEPGAVLQLVAGIILLRGLRRSRRQPA